MCFCDKIPSIDNRTDVIILQHVRERFHAFNTARIVHKALNNATLLVDQNRALANRLGEYPLKSKVGVLYPGPDGRLLTEVPPEERPEQLIVIDGTWHHAKTMLRDIPQLNELPRYRIQPTEPGRYRIRREPNDTALSTLEATVAALRALEPETAGWDELISAFDTMVQSQLNHPTARIKWRKNQKRQNNSMGIPRAIIGCGDDDKRPALENIVVAYGESEPGRIGCKRAPRGKDNRQPIYWVAKRLSTGESFRAAIAPTAELSDDFLDHIKLTREPWRAAQSLDEFVDDWNQFIRPSDTLIMYHAGTRRLLRNVGAAMPNSVILKSIKFDPTNQHTTLESFLRSKGVQINAGQHAGCLQQPSRADQRLANAIALTRYLHQLGCS